MEMSNSCNTSNPLPSQVALPKRPLHRMSGVFFFFQARPRPKRFFLPVSVLRLRPTSVRQRWHPVFRRPANAAFGESVSDFFEVFQSPFSPTICSYQTLKFCIIRCGKQLRNFQWTNEFILHMCIYIYGTHILHKQIILRSSRKFRKTHHQTTNSEIFTSKMPSPDKILAHKTPRSLKLG